MMRQSETVLSRALARWMALVASNDVITNDLSSLSEGRLDDEKYGFDSFRDARQ